MRVRAGSLYIFRANALDLIDPKTNLQDGTLVRVGTLPNSPPPNMMGQCYVFHPQTGEFIGMVSTGSLTPQLKQGEKQ